MNTDFNLFLCQITIVIGFTLFGIIFFRLHHNAPIEQMYCSSGSTIKVCFTNKDDFKNFMNGDTYISHDY